MRRAALAHNPVPSWVLRGGITGGEIAALDFDFQNNRYWQAPPVCGRDPSSLLTVSRALTAYGDDLAGNWYSFPSHTLVVTNKGAQIWEARTNVVLWNRDLTNAAWTKSNITAALDQTGIDGAANSASSITATTGNGTALQAITLSSSARWQTAFVKRITGTGTINMTMDNGSTWTAVTITSAWTRVGIPTQTLANPTVGFQISTSGDAIAVDFVQNENNGFFATSPIRTTSVAATRPADAVVVTKPPAFGSAYTLFAQATPNAATSYGNNQYTLSATDGTLNNRVAVLRLFSTGKEEPLIIGGGSTFLSSNAFSVWTSGVSKKSIVAHAPSDNAGSYNGEAVVSNSTAGVVAPITVLNVGSVAIAATHFDGYIERVALWPTTRLSNPNLQRMTT